MSGKRIEQVDSAICDIKKYLVDLQSENTNVDFYMTIIPFSNNASFYNNKEMINIDQFTTVPVASSTAKCNVA